MSQAIPKEENEQKVVISEICRKLEEAEKSVAEGKTHDMDAVFGEYRKKYSDVRADTRP